MLINSPKFRPKFTRKKRAALRFHLSPESELELAKEEERGNDDYKEGSLGFGFGLSGGSEGGVGLGPKAN